MAMIEIRQLWADFPAADDSQLQIIQDLIHRFRDEVDIHEKAKRAVAMKEITEVFNEHIGSGIMHTPYTISGLTLNINAFADAVDQVEDETAKTFANYILTGKFS